MDSTLQQQQEQKPQCQLFISFLIHFWYDLCPLNEIRFHLITSDKLIQLESSFTVTYYFMYKISRMNAVHSGHTEPLSVPAYHGLLRIVLMSSSYREKLQWTLLHKIFFSHLCPHSLGRIAGSKYYGYCMTVPPKKLHWFAIVPDTAVNWILSIYWVWSMKLHSYLSCLNHCEAKLFPFIFYSPQTCGILSTFW